MLQLYRPRYLLHGHVDTWDNRRPTVTQVGGTEVININPVKALFWTAVINGLLAPFLLVAILFVASDRKLMKNQRSSMLSRVVVAITTLAMFAAATAMCLL